MADRLMMPDYRSRLATDGSSLLVGDGTWRDGARAVLLHSPANIISSADPASTPDLLREAEGYLRAGHFVCGFISFEAGAAYGLDTHGPSDLAPVLWLAVYPEANVQTLDSRELRAQFDPAQIQDVDVRLNVSREVYGQAIGRIKDYIAAGDTYQVNYTCHARFEMQADPLEYFLAMVRSHPVPYAAYLNLGDRQIVSLSPELYIQRRGDTLESKPMKGTRKRGRTPEEDRLLVEDLVSNPKDRAENLMIVDMVRNDIGRVCEIGSVRVPELFSAEKYRSVWQMTSTVTGHVAPNLGLPEIMAATFPGASVTGAPKKRTMQIIRELEQEPRGVYCGAIGLFMPNGDFTCNLPIRTLVHREGHFDLGIGAGIVWDSREQSEYDETLLKSQFAFRVTSELRLWETLLLSENREFAFLEEHLARLQQSADYWDFPLDAQAARATLDKFASEAEKLPLVLRVELDQDGAITLAPRDVPAPVAGPVRIMLSNTHVDSTDRFLVHKTSQRALYDNERQAATKAGFFEVVFANEHGNLTEGSISNVFVHTDRGWITPPVSEGLLPGIWRAAFLHANGGREEPVALSSLETADQICIGNSVRGAIPVDEIAGADGQVIWTRKNR